jgi:glycosyltransferase involved in cell wall biosynthesis
MNVANGFFLPFLKLRGIPTLVNVDGMEWDREKWGKTAKAVFRLGALLTARYSSEIIVDSREIGRRWLKDFHREGHFIPYGGIRYAEPLELEPGLKHRGYVLLVARFVPENTVPLFFEVAPTLATKYPVVIVGSSGFDGQLDEIAKQLATIYPDIHYFGHIHDDQRLLSLWQHAGVYFHGHSVGGTNPTLVQAMALGSPIVARNTPYNREVLGEKGAFFSPSRESILSAIETLMADPEAQAQQERTNIARARALYDWEDVAAKYEELFRSSIK